MSSVNSMTPRDRDETAQERADRNWAELLQELRVSQTGVQLLAGFLATLPFQARFTELDAFQQGWYVGLLGLAFGTVRPAPGPAGPGGQALGRLQPALRSRQAFSSATVFFARNGR